MAYAGVFMMLMNYKMQKCNSDRNLMNLTTEKQYALEDSTNISLAYEHDVEALKAKYAGQDLTNCAAYVKELAELNMDFAEQKAALAAEETEFQTQLDQEQVTNAMLQTEIQNLQSMLQNNIPQDHQYGYQK